MIEGAEKGVKAALDINTGNDKHGSWHLYVDTTVLSVATSTMAYANPAIFLIGHVGDSSQKPQRPANVGQISSNQDDDPDAPLALSLRASIFVNFPRLAAMTLYLLPPLNHRYPIPVRDGEDYG